MREKFETLSYCKKPKAEEGERRREKGEGGEREGRNHGANGMITRENAIGWGGGATGTTRKRWKHESASLVWESLMKGSHGYGRMEENGDGFMNAAKATRRIRSSFARLEFRLLLSYK